MAGLKKLAGCSCKACKRYRASYDANFQKLKRHNRQRVRIALAKGETDIAPYDKGISEVYA